VLRQVGRLRQKSTCIDALRGGPLNVPQVRLASRSSIAAHLELLAVP
jgi:hypothetical protein